MMEIKGNTEEYAERLHFNRIARHYEQMFGFANPPALRKVVRLCDVFAQWINAAVEGPVLEIGAGTGFLTRHLHPCLANRPYLATDISEEMLHVARATMDNSTTVDWQVCDCTALPTGDASIAAVVGHGILHHVPLEKTMGEIARVLKPGGRIAFYEPNLLNPYIFVTKKIPWFRLPGDTPGETALRASVVQRLMRSNGFSVVSVTPVEFTMNGVAPSIMPVVERMSRVLERVPVVRSFGGSLRILGEKL